MEIKVLDKGFVRLVDSMGDDSSIVQAARVSYGEGTKKISEDEGLIRYLIRNKHTTPLEMVQFKFHIKAPIFVIRQWHRHRMWSYNEVSGRYSEMKDEFYIPEANRITKQSLTNKQGSSDQVLSWEDYKNFYNKKDAPEGTELTFFNDSISQIFDNEQNTIREWYEDKIGMDMSKELARINLPLSQYSEMYASVDLHNLFHFLKLRLDSHAQYEIRVYAQAIQELIKSIVPIAYHAFEDYILNSVTLSGKDIEALSHLIQMLNGMENTRENALEFPETSGESIQLYLGNKYFSNKRERDEFITKLNKFLS